jgi:hypothetical protein
MATAPYTKMAFTFNAVKVYDAQFIKERVPTYFTGCSATILKIIEKKNIPVNSYFFASYSNKNGYARSAAHHARVGAAKNAVLSTRTADC